LQLVEQQQRIDLVGARQFAAVDGLECR
jgi:hypothetical protein